MHTANCNLLGGYCWTCQTTTRSGIPGWAKKPKDATFVRRSPWGGCLFNNVSGVVGYFGYTESIIWANGDTEDPRRTYQCSMCADPACKSPVVEESRIKYAEKVSRFAQQKEAKDADVETEDDQKTTEALQEQE